MTKFFIGILLLIFLFFIFHGIFGAMQTTFEQIDQVFHSDVPQISLDD